MLIALERPIQVRTASSRRNALVRERLATLNTLLPERLTLSALFTALALVPPLASGYPPMCAIRFGWAALAMATIVSLAMLPRTRLPRFRTVERGLGTVEILVASAIIAIFIVGISIWTESGTHAATVTAQTDTQSDVGDALDVAATAITAYDSTMRTRVESMPRQTLTINGTPATVAGSASGGGSVSIALGSGQVVSQVVAPLPIPKPTPE
jgi:hypothetical protein